MNISTRMSNVCPFQIMIVKINVFFKSKQDFIVLVCLVFFFFYHHQSFEKGYLWRLHGPLSCASGCHITILKSTFHNHIKLKLGFCFHCPFWRFWPKSDYCDSWKTHQTSYAKYMNCWFYTQFGFVPVLSFILIPFLCWCFLKEWCLKFLPFSFKIFRTYICFKDNSCSCELSELYTILCH